PFRGPAITEKFMQSGLVNGFRHLRAPAHRASERVLDEASNRAPAFCPVRESISHLRAKSKHFALSRASWRIHSRSVSNRQKVDCSCRPPPTGQSARCVRLANAHPPFGLAEHRAP